MDTEHSSASSPSAAQSQLQAVVDHAKTLDCIHCGLCLQSCPTFRLTGAESSSPRGRIHLMRAVGEERCEVDRGYVEELDFCLLCRQCESICPAGVEFGSMMEFARDHVAEVAPRPLWVRALRRIGFGTLLPNRWALGLVASLLRGLQILRLDSLLAKCGGHRGRALAEMPRIPPRRERRPLPSRTVPSGETTQIVAVLEGCVMPELFGRVNRATVRSLSALGIESRTLPGVVCCGSLHAHNGDLSGARVLATKVLDGYERLSTELGTQPSIAINSAGCGAHLRELSQLFPEDTPEFQRAQVFAAKVVDYSEVVAPRMPVFELDLKEKLTHLPQPLAWDDPCHLCHAQGVREQPREILNALHLDQVHLSEPESCCGSAGIYSLLRPQDSAAVFERKRQDFEACGAALLVTANPGCQMQWQAGLKRSGSPAPVLHLAELVDMALESQRRVVADQDASGIKKAGEELR